MSFINKKIFGSDIDSKLKQKLELLQLAVGNEIPDSLVLGNKFDGSKYVKAGEPSYTLEDLLPAGAFESPKQFISQRTPFVRMWTSCLLYTSPSPRDS